MGRAVRSIAAAVAVLSSFAAWEDAVTSVEGPTVGEIVGYVEAYDTTFATIGSKVDTTEHLGHDTGVGFVKFRARVCRGPCPHPGGSLPSSSR